MSAKKQNAQPKESSVLGQTLENGRFGDMGTTVEGSGSVISGTNTGFPIYTPNNQAHGFVYVCEYACLRYFFFLF